MLMTEAPTTNSRPATLSREQVVDRIITINHSATTDFLDRFSDPELKDYLDHLNDARKPRGRRAVRVRRTQTPAIVVRESSRWLASR